MQNINKRRLAIALSAAFVATGAFAQQHAEKIEVTGSNIKRIDTEAPSPIVVITREQIQTSGQRDIAELLRSVTAASAGSQLDNTSNSFSNGAQTVSLRGLGSASTLVLLNGRRITPSAYADPNTGNSTVYNLNSIPFDAIDRIEVLKDGASAIYGSDAMAGVVNIILRRDYRGGEVSGSYSQNLESSEWGQGRASLTMGFGDMARQGWNVLGTFEHFHREPVNIREVGNVAVDDNTRLGLWRTTQTANGYPGNYFRENVLGNGNFATFVASDSHCPAGQNIGSRCRYNTYQDVNVAFKQDRDDVYGRGSFNLSPNHTLSVEGLYSKAKFDYFSTPSSFSNAISVWGDSNGNLRQYRLILPVGHPDNPTTVPVAVAYSFVDAGRRTDKQTNENTRGVASLKGTIAGWDYETGLMYMKNKREDVNGGYLYYPGLVAAMASQSYRFNGQPNSAAVLSQVSTSFTEVGEAKLSSWDLRGSRELFEMAGGPFALAAGVELRKEELNIVSDPKIVAGDIVGRGTSAAKGDRNVQALYGEVSIPFMKHLETQVALRTEHYSDFGNSTTPKFGIKYQPVEMLALRGTFAKGFRAPSLSQISQSSVQAFNNGVRDPLRCPVNDPTNRDCSTSFASYIRANPELKPEKSDNYTLGFILSPTRDFSVSVDYWDIKRKEQIDRFSATYLLARESQFPGAVIRDPNQATWLPGIPNSGPIFAVLRQFFNLAETRVNGVDVDAQYVARLPAGRLTTVFNGTYLAHYKYALAKTDPVVDQAGTFGGPSDALPRFRGFLSSTYATGPISFTGRVNYVSGWFDGAGGTAAQGGGCFFSANQLADPNCRVKPWTTVDAGVVFTGIKNLTLSLEVRNIQGKTAPFDPNSEQTTQNGYNAQFHNALGRYVTAGFSYKFW